MKQALALQYTKSAKRPAGYLGLLYADKFAFASVVFLAVVLASALMGPALLSGPATMMNLSMRNSPPLSGHGWLYVLGADTLGRSVLARVIVASRNTLLVAGSAVSVAMTIGTVLGGAAGFGRSWISAVIMRVTDILMSFPTLLFAVVVLYVMKPSIGNVVLVLAVTRIAVFLRTVRAQVLELRERMFVTASKVMGASSRWIALRHILPLVIPTISTIATLEFSFMMLAESSLTFLGLGIQPPEISWGLMVAEGKNYLISAWWIAFFPGLAIAMTTVSLNLLSNWLRIVNDPQQRWRLEKRTPGKKSA